MITLFCSIICAALSLPLAGASNAPRATCRTKRARPKEANVDHATGSRPRGDSAHEPDERMKKRQRVPQKNLKVFLEKVKNLYSSMRAKFECHRLDVLIEIASFLNREELDILTLSDSQKTDDTENIKKEIEKIRSNISSLFLNTLLSIRHPDASAIPPNSATYKKRVKAFEGAQARLKTNNDLYEEHLRNLAKVTPDPAFPDDSGTTTQSPA